jgi:hypothetical protein
MIEHSNKKLKLPDESLPSSSLGMKSLSKSATSLLLTISEIFSTSYRLSLMKRHICPSNLTVLYELSVLLTSIDKFDKSDLHP